MINNIINKVGIDKILHLLVCLSLTLELRRFVDLWIAVLIVFVIAVFKEVYDKVSKKGTCDYKDIIADCVGIIIGCL